MGKTSLIPLAQRSFNHVTGCQSVSCRMNIKFICINEKPTTTILNKMEILNNRKFGFRPGLSTFDALNTFTSDLYTALNNNKSVVSIFIDFRKAFDTVQHKILLNKMYHYGIRGCFHDRFKSNLNNRQQHTAINSTLSQ
uniref:Reverse transcriptase domain-containing protein n=1 Tax=Scylla olivacea TaxID=85551 RepID=A0A0P4VU25_SCYOL